MFRKKIKTASKTITSQPIHIGDKTYVTIHVLDVTMVGAKDSSIYGTLSPKGVMVIDKDKHEFLSIDETFEFENMTELDKFINN
ncbi:hypothetical protein EZV73_06585 [Acidaminobacter sp. JC074]|uniref:hypothetical protein n=1 Tax=Acidaminobacter sp. JC074 TaxID=2530199 RepID=UPI001F114634|nr:hypothetical protein [Acidaminobacter sp. JC074]MCH4887229.1 hypothetical protein [Acidaminobacter sp. JC074]